MTDLWTTAGVIDRISARLLVGLTGPVPRVLQGGRSGIRYGSWFAPGSFAPVVGAYRYHEPE